MTDVKRQTAFFMKHMSATVRFSPEITLDPNANYFCVLLDFTSYNSIPNIISGENSDFKYKHDDE